MRRYFITIETAPRQTALSQRVLHWLTSNYERCVFSEEQLAVLPTVLEDYMKSLLAAHRKWKPLHISTRGFVPRSVPGVPNVVRNDRPKVDILLLDIPTVYLTITATQIRSDRTQEGGEE